MSGSSPLRAVVVACASLAVVLVAGCGGAPSQVSFVSNEQPTNSGSSEGVQSREAAHNENPNGHVELGDDDFKEPEHPLAETKQERALVHIHGPKGRVCSGVVIGQRVVATAQRCLKGEAQGASSLGPDHEYRIEIASSTLTWTNRKAKYAVIPKCDEHELDVALLILEDPVPALVVPLKIVSAPDTGAHIHALGFGHCEDMKEGKERSGTVRSRVSQALVIDLPLCKGDVGGPVLDGRDGEVIGLISHRDDPEGSPLKTTTIARLDTTWARDLIAQAKLLSDGGDTAKVQSVACR
jgi:hypothetical protein